MPEPPSLDVEPERPDESRSRVTLIAVAALLLLVALIAIVVIAGNSGDDESAPRVSNLTDVLAAERNGTRVTVAGEIQGIQEEGRIFALADSNAGEPGAVSEGAVLVVSERTADVSEGDTVEVTGRVYELESEQVTEAAGRELGGADGYPEFRGQPVVIASEVGVG